MFSRNHRAASDDCSADDEIFVLLPLVRNFFLGVTAKGGRFHKVSSQIATLMML